MNLPQSGDAPAAVVAVIDRLLPQWLVTDAGKQDLTLIFTGLAVVVAVLLPVIALSTRRWRTRHPFDMRFCEQPLEVPPEQQLSRTFRKEWELPRGRSAMRIRVTTKTATVANPFDVRFVEWDFSRFIRRRNAPSAAVEIVDVNIPDWDREAEAERDFVGYNTVSKKPNGVGGYIVTARKAKQWIVGKPLWFEIVVEARAPWCGSLSFEGRTDRRAFSRRSVWIR